MKYGPEQHVYNLPCRAYIACVDLKLYTKDQIEAAVKEGKLDPARRPKTGHYGTKSYHAILLSLGMAPPEKPKRLCPYCRKPITFK